jgi:hypothetical protein
MLKGVVRTQRVNSCGEVLSQKAEHFVWWHVEGGADLFNHSFAQSYFELFGCN